MYVAVKAARRRSGRRIALAKTRRAIRRSPRSASSRSASSSPSVARVMSEASLYDEELRLANQAIAGRPHRGDLPGRAYRTTLTRFGEACARHRKMSIARASRLLSRTCRWAGAGRPSTNDRLPGEMARRQMVRRRPKREAPGCRRRRAGGAGPAFPRVADLLGAQTLIETDRPRARRPVNHPAAARFSGGAGSAPAALAGR